MTNATELTLATRFQIHDLVNQEKYDNMSWSDVKEWIENEYPLRFDKKDYVAFRLLDIIATESKYDFIPVIGNENIAIGIRLWTMEVLVQ